MVALKRAEWEKGWVGGLRGMGTAGFCGPCVCLGVFLLCSGGYLCQGLQGAGLYTVGTVGYSAGGECVGERGSVMTGWGRIKRRGEDRKKWMRRGRKSS
jgi:hypothetical protein